MTFVTSLAAVAPSPSLTETCASSSVVRPIFVEHTGRLHSIASECAHYRFSSAASHTSEAYRFPSIQDIDLAFPFLYHYFF